MQATTAVKTLQNEGRWSKVGAFPPTRLEDISTLSQMR